MGYHQGVGSVRVNRPDSLTSSAPEGVRGRMNTPPLMTRALLVLTCAGIVHAAPVIGSLIEIDAVAESPAFNRYMPNVDIVYNSRDNEYMVVYTEGANTFTDTGVSATRIDGDDGTVLQTLEILAVGGMGMNPTVAYASS